MITSYYNLLPDKGDILAHLWQRFQTEPFVPEWMWGYGPGPSMTQFILYFSNPERHLFLPVRDDGEILGMLWVDEVVPPLRGRCHMYFFHAARRQRIDHLGADILTACHQVAALLANPPFGLGALFFYTDDRAVALKNFASKRMSIQYVASLPYYYPNTTVSVGYLSLAAYREKENANGYQPVRSTEDLTPTDWLDR